MSDAPVAATESGAAGSAPVPVLPDYGGACLTSIVPAVLSGLSEPGAPAPAWMPAPVRGARQVVLLLLDGLGWEQLQRGAAVAPTLAGAAGGPISSVAPTTTATALTSLTTGTPPSVHGIVGYRLRVDAGPGGDEPGDVMNVLRWRTARGDMRRRLPPPQFQPTLPFGGRSVPAVTRSEFASTGFTAAHLSGVRLLGWSVPSSLVVNVGRALGAGETFVYAYYDGLDKVAHEHGLGDYYRQELTVVDRLIGDILDVLPPGAALVVTSDHGQVEVGSATRLPAPALFDMVDLFSGEGRFRWMHVRPGSLDDVVALATEAHGAEAWVCTRDQMVEEGWFGGPLSVEVARRLGDVALVAHAPVAFLDPADTGETRLMGRHGSLTPAEMAVPLVAFASNSRRAHGSGRGRDRASTAAFGGRPPVWEDRTMDKEPQKPGAVESGDAVLLEPGERPSGLVPPGAGAGEAGAAPDDEPDVTEAVQQPAKVMRIGSMVKQLLDEVRAAGMDEASRTRLREIYELSVRELAGALSPDLAAELGRMTLPFDKSIPSEAELRVAQAQLVGWLEGLFHGIQATLMAQQMAARAQLEEMRQRGLPPGMASPDNAAPRPGTYL